MPKSGPQIANSGEKERFRRNYDVIRVVLYSNDCKSYFCRATS